MLGVFSVQCIGGYHQCSENCTLHLGDFHEERYRDLCGGVMSDP